MKKVSLQFKSLSELAECMFALGVNRPEISYKDYVVTVALSDEQFEQAVTMKAHVVDAVVVKL